MSMPMRLYGGKLHENIIQSLNERNNMSYMTKDRLRAFMSQYVIARAASFSKGSETEDAWECMLRARTIFHALDKVADAEPEDQPMAQQAGQNSVGSMIDRPPWSTHRFDPANNYRDHARGVLTEDEAGLTQGTLAKLYKAAMGRITPNDQNK